MRTLEKDARDILRGAQNILKKSEEIAPHVLIINQEAKAIFYVGLAVDKHLWRGLVSECVKRLNANRWVFVDEVWSVSPKDWVQSMAVSENPARFECIFVLACDRTGESFSIKQQFLRDPKRIQFLEPITATDCDTCLLPMRW